LFHQPDRSRYVLSLVNFQHDLPNVPVDGIEVRLRLPGRVRKIEVLPSGTSLRHHSARGMVMFTAPRLHTLALMAVTCA
jgi:hypothetical protein